MNAQPTLTLAGLLATIIDGIANAVCERPGESLQQRATRIRAASETIRAFQPGDAIQAMLAGHCLMFHELIVDSVLHTLRGEPDTARRATRSNIVAMDKAFGNNLTRLERAKTRDAEASPDVQPLPFAETEIADRVARHQSRPNVPAQTASIAARPINPRQPIPLDATSPWPAAPLNAASPRPEQPDGDAPTPRDVQMSCSNSQLAGSALQPPRAIYAGNRQARRHPIRNVSATRIAAATGA